MLIFIVRLAIVFRVSHGLATGAVVCNALPTSTYLGQMIARPTIAKVGTNSSFVLGIDGNGYRAGQANIIWVNRTKGNMTLGFRGLMLYVLNGMNVKIGDWNITSPANVHSAICAQNGDTLTHKQTSLGDNTFAKNQFFIWNAPASTTGPVQIHAVAFEVGARIFNVPEAITVSQTTSAPTTSGPTSVPSTSGPTSAPTTSGPTSAPSTSAPSTSPVTTTTGLLTTVTQTTSTAATSVTATARESTTQTAVSQSTTTVDAKFTTASSSNSTITTSVTGSMSTTKKTNNINQIDAAQSFVFVTVIVQVFIALLFFV